MNRVDWILIVVWIIAFAVVVVFAWELVKALAPLRLPFPADPQ